MKKLWENSSGMRENKKLSRNREERERGDILILTAVIMVVLIFFIGLSVDLSVVYLRSSRLDDYCQMARDSRFTHESLVTYGDDPGDALYMIIRDALQKNGFSGKMTLTYEEDPPSGARRHYSADLSLTETCPLYFLVIFGKDEVTLTNSISFEGEIGASSDEAGNLYDDDLTDKAVDLRIWYPDEVKYGFRRTYTE